MKITFVSNYINHHQIPFCDELYSVLGEDFAFVQTEPMEEERVSLGWDAKDIPTYVVCSYEKKALCEQKVMESDVVIWGGVEDESMLKPRLAAGKVVLRYCERMYKTGQWKAISPRGLIKKYGDHTKYRKKPVYLMCAGAFVASDYNIIKAYPNKKMKWGYFPEFIPHDIEVLMARKSGKNGKCELLWAARFIDWKHPELVVECVEVLKEQREDFHVTMIGGGQLKENVEMLIQEKGLENYITLAGTKTPKQVREMMERADIFLMTSDRNEGWGAVMNEAMNSGCAVIADRMEGASLFLIRPGENGFLYTKAQGKEIAKYVNLLLEDRERLDHVARAAYETIEKEWNPQVAAKRILQICEDILSTKGHVWRWESGPGSKAKIIKERSCCE